MLIPTEKAAHFLQAYKELLSAVAGHLLTESLQYAEARRAFFENEELVEKPPTEDPDLQNALKSARFGRFVIARHLVRWTEMIGPDNRVYRVKGITTELRDLASSWIVARTAVMQFREEWICDGLVEPFNIQIGPGMRKDLMAMIRRSAPKRRQKR